MYVIGMGEKKTPKPFIAACDKFVYLEIISSEDEPTENVSTQKSKKTKKSIYQPDKKLIHFISSSINDVADENGWAFLGEVGTLLLKKQPNFDPRNYGFQKLTPLIASLKKFEIDERESDNPNIKLIYIRNKQ